MIMTVPVGHQIRTHWLLFHIPELPLGPWLFSISIHCLILTAPIQDFQNLGIAMEVAVPAVSTVKEVEVVAPTAAVQKRGKTETLRLVTQNLEGVEASQTTLHVAVCEETEQQVNVQYQQVNTATGATTP